MLSVNQVEVFEDEQAVAEVICPCSTHGGCLSARCANCAGFGVVAAEDAGAERCARCAAQDDSGPMACGLGGVL